MIGSNVQKRHLHVRYGHPLSGDEYARPLPIACHFSLRSATHIAKAVGLLMTTLVTGGVSLALFSVDPSAIAQGDHRSTVLFVMAAAFLTASFMALFWGLSHGLFATWKAERVTRPISDADGCTLTELMRAIEAHGIPVDAAVIERLEQIHDVKALRNRELEWIAAALDADLRCHYNGMRRRPRKVPGAAFGAPVPAAATR